MGVEQRVVGGGRQDGIAGNADAGDGRVGHGFEIEQPGEERREQG